MRLILSLLLFPVALFAAPQSVSIDTATKKVINPEVHFGIGNTLDATGATLIGFPGGSGAVFSTGTPLLDQVAIWTDASHIQGVTTIKGGTTGQALVKSSNADYDYIWATVTNPTPTATATATPTATATSTATSTPSATSTPTATPPFNFGTFSVSGQSDVVADQSSDTATFAAGNAVIITTNASTDTVTFAVATPTATPTATPSNTPTPTPTPTNIPAHTYYGNNTGSPTQPAFVSLVAADIPDLSGTYQPLDSDLTSWAGVTRASGFDTFTATPSSANLRSLLTDENGTGVALFDGSTSATFVTPALGTPTALVATNATGTANGLTAGDVTRNHAVYAGASPPTVDVGTFTIAVTGVNLKAAGTTAVFTVPASRAFVCTYANALVTAVTTGGAGTMTFQIQESSSNRVMSLASTSGSHTPVANQTFYALSTFTSGTSPQSTCAAGNIVNVVVSTSHAGSTAVTGTVYVTGFYVQ